MKPAIDKFVDAVYQGDMHAFIADLHHNCVLNDTACATFMRKADSNAANKAALKTPISALLRKELGMLQNRSLLSQKGR